MTHLINEVVNNGLCTGCGTCYSLCPSEAIAIVKNESNSVYIPRIDHKICNKCGVCFKVCPGHSVDFICLNQEQFGNKLKDNLIGNYISCYMGHATNFSIRNNSTSGGLISSILIFALENGIIDGALVTKMNEKNPLEPEVFIAQTKEEIISASKSKYCPVPVNMLIKEILKREGKFAVVGLPCHIHGIIKAEKINKKLREKLVLHLGLFCSHAPTFKGTEIFLNKINIKKEDIEKLDYRTEGWPGGMLIKLKNGNKKFIALRNFWKIIGSPYFFSVRCTLCCDGTSELADLSFGDAWLPELSNDKEGMSIIISRNNNGEKIMQDMAIKNVIKLKIIDHNKVIQSQKWMLDFKKKSLKARIFIVSLIGKRVPLYTNMSLITSGIKSYFEAILYYFRIYISSKHYLNILLHILLNLQYRNIFVRIGKK